MKDIKQTIDVEHEFAYELSCIEDEVCKSIAINGLKNAPDYFFYVPASSSGKYHPKSSLGLAGLVRHVKSVFRISEELLAHKLYCPYQGDEKDMIRVAILLHDCLKQGLAGTHTVPEHPLLVREALHPLKGRVLQDDLPTTIWADRVEQAWDIICSMIETHMGIWNTDKEGKEIMDIPKTKGQLHVHMCDYLASRKCIEVDVTPREAQSNYNKKDESNAPAWMNDLATEGQIGFIKKLLVTAMNKGVSHPYDGVVLVDNSKIVITKGKASNMIKTLQGLTGQ
ncbi:hypothetical protein [Bacillus phage CP-51]|uniref:HD domain-containing protein n=1 Tax=Bacillus phage CP-51 TaxID=1391188 RepID=A0A068EQA6_9CAUD|nr:hypothetical protein OZ73_gp097 [Bacillus phage CP-51]AID50532.1 hypothetical protein [Bacillus phage CP-51]